jgi:hypothetical protein
VHKKYRIPAVGLELMPTYVKVAQKVVQMHKLAKIAFMQADVLQADLSKGTIFFLAGTCFSGPSIVKITKKLEQLPVGTIVITTSFALNSPLFTLRKKLCVPFSWGMGHIFIQEITDLSQSLKTGS